MYDETFRPIVEAVLEGYNGEGALVESSVLKLLLPPPPPNLFQEQYLPMDRLALERRTRWKVRPVK